MKKHLRYKGKKKETCCI